MVGGPPQLLTDDGHHGVEVPDVEALPGHVDEELQHAGPVLLLHHLEGTSSPSMSTTGAMSLPPPVPEGYLVGVAPEPTELSDPGWGALVGCRGRKRHCGLSDSGKKARGRQRGLSDSK